MAEIEKLEYLKNKKSFLDEIKSIPRNYLRISFGQKKEKQWTQTLINYLQYMPCHQNI